MTSKIPILIARFIVLIFLQILIFNNVNFSGYINPYFYVLFIILLPFETPKWASLCMGFILGLIIDIFSNTIGMHAAACTFMTYNRQILLHLLAPRDGYEFGLAPKLKQMGPAWFSFFSITLIFSHHFFLFFLEAFKASEFFFTLGRSLLSSLFTILLVFLSELLFYHSKR